jgi:hypothetical protein
MILYKLEIGKTMRFIIGLRGFLSEPLDLEVSVFRFANLV